MFEINYDLDYIKFKNWHNWFHLCISIIFVILFNLCGYSEANSTIITYLIGFAWEIGDGFKPWFYKFRYDNSEEAWKNFLRQNLLYSNKFSLQDIFLWNLMGCTVGYMIATLI